MDRMEPGKLKAETGRAHDASAAMTWPRRGWLAATLGLLVGAPGLRAAPAPTLLVLGDSLSAEYGLPRGQGWVALLEARLQREKLPHRVVNASISGETTAGGRSRLPRLLAEHAPRLLLIELGGNDGLRGLPLPEAEANLRAMVRAGRAAGARVLLLGMRIPPNYGRRYSEDFAALFGRVAQAEGAALQPFFLEPIAAPEQLGRHFQPDRIHPRAEAQPLLLDGLWPTLAPLLRAR